MPRVIRKLDLAGRPTFDEQLWPINALLVVFCALVAGVIIGTSEFSEELSWQNGWLRLATLVGSVGLLMLLAWWFRGRLGRRFQLGAAASLFLHVVVGILLHSQYMDLLDDDRETARRDTVPVLVQYEYHVRAPDELTPQEAHERPVDTETPENRPIEQARTPPAEPPLEVREPLPLPQTQPTVEPTRVEMKRNEFRRAKRADQESLLSRSTTQTPAQPSEQISAPEQRAATEPAEQTLQAAATAVARSETSPAATSSNVETPTKMEVTREAAQAVRRAVDSPSEPAPSETAPALARAVAAPADVPRVAEAAPANPATAESQQQPNTAANTAIARSSTASPLARSEPALADSPTQSAAIAPAASARGATGDAQPSVASTNSPAGTSRNIAPAAATTAAAADQPAGVATNAPAQSLAGPAQTSVARAASTLSSGNPAQSSALDAAAVGASPAAATRRDASSSPSLSAAAQRTNAPGRAVAASSRAASPLNLESPALAAAASADNTPRQQPAATALSRATAGVAGAGQSPNFDRGLPGPANNTTIAAAASQRASSSVDAGAAPAASSPSALRRSRSEATIDSTTAIALYAAPADYRGGPSPAQLEATSGGALERSASAAASGQIASTAGNLPADTGAPQVVSRRGLARSDGGGQPSVAAVATPGQPGRTTAAGENVAAVASDVRAPSSVAPATQASGPASGALAAQSSNTRSSATSSSPAGAPGELTGAASPAAQAAVAAATGAPSRSETGAPAAAAASSGAPARSTTPAVIGDTRALDVQVAGTPSPAGASEPTPLQASATSGSRNAAGLPGRAALADGAVAAGASVAPANAVQGAVAGRRASQTGDNVPAVNGAAAGSAVARSTASAIPAAPGAAIEVPELASGAPLAAASAAGDAQPGPSTGPGDIERRSSGGLPVQVASVAGPGGLASELSAVVGSRKISAQRESDLIHDTDTRFLGREIAGAVPEPGFIRDAAKGFERRGRDNGTGQGQQGAKTEEAIERGLEFLARSQQEDGSWSFQKFAGATEDDAGTIQSDTAATGLALMAFLGGGYDHFEDKHQATVRRGLQFLLRQQTEDGDLYFAQDPESHKSAWLYSHAIASIALCEALGMTGDPELRGPAQRAIEFIEAAQDRQFGGWRYEPGVGSDTSVAGWMLMALKSGELSGLKVKPDTYEAVRKWLDRARMRSDASQYVYNPTQPNTQYVTDQRRPTMTSVGMLMRLYLGWNRTRPEFQRGAEHILKYPAAYGTSSDPKRDTYYWYYATQVMFHMGQKHWEQWRAALHPMLVNSQVRQGAHSGSWNPNGNIPDRWGPHGGRIYVTTLNLLSLEVRYRHLPIYEETAR